MIPFADALKPWARHARAVAVRVSGRLARLEAGQEDALTILCYHRVLPLARKRAYFIPDLVVTPEGFAAQCAIVRDRFDVRPLGEAVDCWRAGGARARPLAAITFDDGYRDNFAHAFPVLEALGLRATFFVVTGLVGVADATWYDHLGHAAAAAQAGPGRAAFEAHFEAPVRARLQAIKSASAYACAVVEHAKALSPEARAELIADAERAMPHPPMDPALDCIMDAAQLRALHAAGHEIASHTHTHPLLPQLAGDALRDELVQSRDTIAELVGQAPRGFCYPNGDHNEAVVEAVRGSGYEMATTTQQGVNAPGADPLRLARVFVHEERLARPWGGVSTSLLRLECTSARHR